jgi:hypothetical protein
LLQRHIVQHTVGAHHEDTEKSQGMKPRVT